MKKTIEIKGSEKHQVFDLSKATSCTLQPERENDKSLYLNLYVYDKHGILLLNLNHRVEGPEWIIKKRKFWFNKKRLILKNLDYCIKHKESKETVATYNEIKKIIEANLETNENNTSKRKRN